MIRRNSLEKINRINPDLGLLRVMTHHNACLTSKRHTMFTLIAALALIWATGRLDVTPRALLCQGPAGRVCCRRDSRFAGDHFPRLRRGGTSQAKRSFEDAFEKVWWTYCRLSGGGWSPRDHRRGGEGPVQQLNQRKAGAWPRFYLAHSAILTTPLMKKHRLNLGPPKTLRANSENSYDVNDENNTYGGLVAEVIRYLQRGGQGERHANGLPAAGRGFTAWERGLFLFPQEVDHRYNATGARDVERGVFQGGISNRSDCEAWPRFCPFHHL
jgi:hypothetical protein